MLKYCMSRGAHNNMAGVRGGGLLIVASTTLLYLSGVTKQQRLESLNNGLADGTSISFDVTFDLGHSCLGLKLVITTQ